MSDRRAFLKGLGALPVAAALAGRAQAQNPTPKLKAMLGDYKHSRALHAGAVKSSRLQLDIAPVAVPSTAFARTVAMEFDVSELSLVTFLQAKAAGRKLVLVPAVYLSRFQHPFLLYNSARGTMAPKISKVRASACASSPRPRRHGCAASSPTITAWISTRSSGAPGRSRTCRSGAIRPTSR